MLKLFSRKKAGAGPDLESILGNYELPSFPGLVMSALEKMRDEDAALTEIADIVSSDPGMTVKLLGMINSAAFGLRHRVKSVHHAISLLGRSQTESILIGMAVRDTLPRTTAQGFDASRFWKAAARRAVAARALADRIDPSVRSECFTAALLQDMAIPVLASCKGAEYGELLESWHRGDEGLDVLEQERFEWTHAQVAGSMCVRWEFPEAVSEAIATHHDALSDESVVLAPVRLVASLVESDEERGVDTLIRNAHEYFQLDADRTAELLEEAFLDAASLEELLG